jgi:anaerobic selenocysteine-containing dehydrogenase
MDREHLRTCSICEAMCGIIVRTDGERITEIVGDPDDPFSEGHICPKALALKDLFTDSDRLRTPLRQTASGWRHVGWTEALDEAARRIREVQAKHGDNSVAVYLGNPNAHSYSNLMVARPFIQSLRTERRYSATSLDQLPHMLAAHLMLGAQLLLPVPDLERTDLLVVLGANPVRSNGSLMSAGNVRKRLDAIAKRGRLIVVDPVRTATAAIATTHLPIRPGADAAWLLALVNEVLAQGPRLGRLAAHITGVDALRSAVVPFTPESVAAFTGIDADTTRTLATDLCTTDRAAVYGRIGICVQEFGGLATWAMVVLNVVTGHLDEVGGMMFPTPAVDLSKLAGRGRFARRHSAVRGLPAFSGELPAATMAEEMETDTAPIRCLVTLAGNPVLSTPNGTRLERNLPKLELVISIDPYINETSRHAHLILPPTMGLEHDHYDLAFHQLAVRNTAKYSPAIKKRDPDQRHDWEILMGLGARLKFGRVGGMAMSNPIAARATHPKRALDLLLRRGPGRGGLSLRKLRQHPHGLDLGPLESCLIERLATDDGTVHLAPQPYLDDLPRLIEALTAPPPEGRPYVLLGRRELNTNNSWLHNVPHLITGKRRCTLRMHPDDAGDLADGTPVRVTSRVGEITVPLELCRKVRPGVVSLPHGWGHHRPGTRLSIASTRPGASINDLTDDQLVDPMSGNAAYTAVRVSVEAV